MTRLDLAILDRMIALLIALVISLVIAGCGSRNTPLLLPTDGGEAYTPELVTPSVRADNFMLRQRILATYGERDPMSFEAILKKEGDTLVLLALSPFGTKALALEQKGTELQVTSYMDREFPFPPVYILYDIQRAYFRGNLEAQPDGEFSFRDGNEEVTEVWSEGRLLERRFVWADKPDAGPLVLCFEGGMAPGDAPPLIELRNEEFGYQLQIELLEHTPLQ